MAIGARILLIISGGIAAYKVLELIRRGRERGLSFPVILTRGGQQFVTPLSIAALSNERVYQDLFSLTDESEMGHIRLAREADVIVVAPASADILAKIAHGLADDLATTTLLASDKPILVAPAMNATMWKNAATQDNVNRLRARNIRFIGPASGDLACKEEGEGRLAEPAEILDAIEAMLRPKERLLEGYKALVTSGPTWEAIDPVRYIANHSSGKQGHAIAAALAELGAQVILVSGPTNLPDPANVTVRHVTHAREMMEVVTSSLPVDVAVCAAAISDWRPANVSSHKIKKNKASEPPTLELVANPDILASLSVPGKMRPRLVVGFAAETENILQHATMKRAQKGCDWILANEISASHPVFGSDRNKIHLISEAGHEDWPEASKIEIARILAERIAIFLKSSTKKAHRHG